MSEIRGWVLDFICLFFIPVEVLSLQMVIQIWNLGKLPDCNKNCGNNNFQVTFEALRLISLSREGVMTRKKRRPKIELWNASKFRGQGRRTT